MLTVKNNDPGNQEFEKMLKDKMNELSDSVDCFDKISARAFPKEESDFSESGFTVSDLENVTGRSHKLTVLKWSALAAAAAVCIAVIPKTGIVQRVFSDMGGSVKKNYQRLITEINTEVSENEYRSFDVPLDFYIKNDVLVTPLFSCPFEDCGKTDAMVRVYIRQVGAAQGSGGYDTAQVYAVEYTGEYSDSNIIAAAQSAYTFTESDFDSIEYSGSFNDELADETVERLFGDDGAGYYVNSNGEAVSLASFTSVCYIKDNGGVKVAQTQVLYGHEGLSSSDSYFYDIITCFGDKEITLPERNEMWKKSIYFNGNSALPTENDSSFTKTEMFRSTETSKAENRAWAYILPFAMQSGTSDFVVPGNYLVLRDGGDSALMANVLLPADQKLNSSLSIYFSPFRQELSDTSLSVEIDAPYADSVYVYQTTFPNSSFVVSSSYDQYKEAEQARIAEEQARIAAEEEAMKNRLAEEQARIAAEEEAMKNRLAEEQARQSEEDITQAP